ncbi:hypothetical protein K438DRAFT_2069989 [Mycena galopus ATCC 62051]|nr:hypothetical protein K438DRAFT_2069989 [Mycena galopus ATCC 62051]
MTRVTAQETRRLFGEFQPDWKTNVRHRAILCKALELFTTEQLVATFGPRPLRLQVAMGKAGTFSQLGKIRCNYVHNNRLVSLETDTLPLEARQRLQDYAAVYNAAFMSRANDYAARHPHARADLQVAEQAWHDWVVGYQPRPRPDWALQPLPGLQMVRVAGPARRVPIPIPIAHHVVMPVPIAPARVTVAVPITPTRPRRSLIPLPTPPPSSPISEAGGVPIPIARRVAMPVPIAPARVPILAPARVTVAVPITPTRPRRSVIPLPTPPPSSPVSEAGDSFLNPIDVSDGNGSDEDSDDQYFGEDIDLPVKRNFLGTIEISDEEGEADEEERPSKRIRFLGVLDLTT